VSGLRTLLRLDDKLAAEGRRLERVGGPSAAWLAPLTLIAAATLHVAILLLPAVTSQATLPPASRVPDFPLVWRPAPPPAPPLTPAPAPPPAVAARAGAIAGNAVSYVDSGAPPPAMVAGRMTIEPVPEPDPELVLGRLSVNVEAIIPPPDDAPDSLGPGPRPAAAAPAESTPAPIEHVSPVYPAAARSLRAEGRVTLRLLVLPDGSVGTAAVEECTRPGLGFEAAALAAVKRWRYEPVPPSAGSRQLSVTVHFQKQGGQP